MNKELAQQTIDNHKKLLELAEIFYKEKSGNPRSNIRLDEWGNIQHEINTACNCHPEYDWEVHTYFEEFSEWLDKQTKEN